MDEGASGVAEISVKDKKDERNLKSCRLPLTRVKTIMKMDPDICFASQESVYLIGKATELFIQELARQSYVFTAQNKKKTLNKSDVDFSISAVDNFVFLEGALH